MSEVLVVYDATFTGPDGRTWTAQVCGGVAGDGLWEGWLEFLPRTADGPAVRTGRETEQPNRYDLLYWAQGLTQVYLDGALLRALTPGDPAVSVRAIRDVQARPAFGAFGGAARGAERLSADRVRRALLNPFEVYLQGEDILIHQLAALDAPRLRDIAITWGFGSADQTAGMGHEELTSLIIARVRPRSGAPPATDLRQRP
ncbi:MAG TPA: hypothetical protein VH277_19500 [Gemmatimonadaceae bacterium]|nr:hypothetical protein [Gemmatimonadaceae bacterium]